MAVAGFSLHITRYSARRQPAHAHDEVHLTVVLNRSVEETSGAYRLKT
jgi:hypothetical protein